MFDLAGVIDYILNLTGNNGVYYVGHSQGTTEYLVGQIVKPIKIHSQCEISIHFWGICQNYFVFIVGIIVR